MGDNDEESLLNSMIVRIEKLVSWLLLSTVVLINVCRRLAGTYICIHTRRLPIFYQYQSFRCCFNHLLVKMNLNLHIDHRINLRDSHKPNRV